MRTKRVFMSKKKHKKINIARSTFFERQCSEETNKQLNKEIGNVGLTAEELGLEELLGTKDDRVRARQDLQRRLIAHNYEGLTFVPEQTFNEIFIFDHITGYEHHFTINFSYPMENGDSKYTELNDAQKYIEHQNKAEKVWEEYTKLGPTPIWKLTNGGFQVDATNGVFLDFEEEAVDYIPCVCTPMEQVVCSEALLGLGKGDVRRGGMLMCLLNAIWAHQGRELKKKGHRIKVKL